MKKISFSAKAKLTLIVCTLLFSKVYAATPTACQSLTPTAVQTAIDLMGASLTNANIDVEKFGVTGSYANATTNNRDSIKQAWQIIVSLQTWLKVNKLDTLYVTNTSASYVFYARTADSLTWLHLARHWAGISAVYHNSKAARQSMGSTIQAINLLETLSNQASICYVDRLAPFTH